MKMPLERNMAGETENVLEKEMLGDGQGEENRKLEITPEDRGGT